MTPYDKLMARKRKWTPVKPTAGICKEGAEETIHRALALRHMELPVGDFIQNALNSEVPSVARDILLSLTSGMKRTMTWHSVTSPMLTAWMKKLKPKHSNYEKLGFRIRITRLPKQWLPSVQFSSYYCRFFGLMVTLECEQYLPT